MTAVIIGADSTPFGKWPHRSYKDLTEETCRSVLADAGLPDGRQVDEIWFANCTMQRMGQANIRGQVCLSRLLRDGVFAPRTPVFNVENACASSTAAFYGAVGSVLSGRAKLALVVGVEKLVPDDGGRADLSLFDTGMDQMDPEEWLAYYAAAGAEIGLPFARGADRSIAMDTYAVQAAFHMREHGTTQRQIAMAAAQTHTYAVENPKAQYRFALTPQEVLDDRPITFPFTRAMCAPIGDGAAALLVASDDLAARLDPAHRHRAVSVLACAAAGGAYRDWREPSQSHVAAARAFAEAGLSPADVSVAEVHDATSFSVIYQAEMMGLCPLGRGGALVESGETGPGGRIPINTSGGLVSKGHPVAATGASMIYELMLQLRGEAGARQVPGAAIGLAENGGGIVGFDEAIGFVTLLGAPS